MLVTVSTVPDVVGNDFNVIIVVFIAMENVYILLCSCVNDVSIVFTKST